MKNRLLLYFIFSSFLYFSCASDANDVDEATDVTDSTKFFLDSAMLEIDSVDSVEVMLDTVEIIIPMLSQIIETKAKPVIKEQFSHYINALRFPSEIKEEKDIKMVISMRDSLISTLQYGFLEDYYYKELEEKKELKDSLAREFVKIGIKAVYAEGMYAGLTESPVLVAKIEKIASPAFKLYIAFQQAWANSLGTEYTYMDLEPEANMVVLGEKLRKDFPKSEYVALTKDSYSDAIYPLTNVHALEHEGAISYIVGGMETDVYPGGTEITNHKDFVKKYPNTKLTPLVNVILSNISTLNSESDTIFAIVTDWVNTYSQAREKASNYVLAGKDIPHFSEIKTPNGKKIALIYRFYSNSEMANSQLDKAKVLAKQAEIVKVSLKDYKQFE
ncbi:MAG: hypothetical protein ACI85I_000555 [Arenicella sp.]|jgi:hypothetical protein